jgi:hypothetical protein
VPPAEVCNGTDDSCSGIPDDTTGCRRAVYRFICGSDHFYKNDLSEPAGCLLEGSGPAFYTYDTLVSGVAFSTTEFYRLFIASGPDHFYTASVTERDAVIAGGGILEASIGYCSLADMPGFNTPLYRLRSTTSGEHFYTTSALERDAALAGTYVSEGIACYVWAGP